MKNNEKQLKDEFKDFLELSEENVSLLVAQTIKQKIYQELHPSLIMIFIILTGIQLVAGTFSLALCNQFGMNPFQTSFSLSEYFMHYGHTFCMFCCGLLFLSVGPLCAGFFLSRDQIRVLRQKIFIFIPLITLSSLTLFLLLGAMERWEIVIAWLVGALIGGIVTTEIHFRVRFFRLS